VVDPGRLQSDRRRRGLRLPRQVGFGERGSGNPRRGWRVLHAGRGRRGSVTTEDFEA
jgi:hypothetical protein